MNENHVLIISTAVIFELPWQFGFGSFALYLIGIAQTLADVSILKIMRAPQPIC